MRVLLFVALVAGAPRVAVAEHQHGAAPASASAEGGSELSAGVSVVAARFETKLYEGHYQGITPSVGWSRGRFAVAANLPVYWIERNGAGYSGLGDAFVHGQATVVDRGRGRAGVVLGVSAPTGDASDGLGMGHVMVMPAAWGSWRAGRATLGGSLGYARALGEGSGGHHDHAGAWPLVEPMNRAELTWTATLDVALATRWRAGLRAGGAAAIGEGEGRATTGVRAAWAWGRGETGVEIAAGVVGDPFTVRGVVDTALRF